MSTSQPAAAIRLRNDAVGLVRYIGEHGWTEGLPGVPPATELVEEMVNAMGRPPDEVVAVLPPRFAEATVEQIAANAVLAGCEPRVGRLLLTAVDAIADPAFNLNGVQATTHPCGVTVIVSGPLAVPAGIHGGEGCLGPGYRSNVTLGRAVRLIMMNIGGALPGSTDRACQGTPAKLGLCFTENLAASSWPAFHEDEGWAPDVTTVTVVAAEGPHNIQDHWSRTPEGMLDTVGGALRNIGGNNFSVELRKAWGDTPTPWRPRPVVLLGPEHAATISQGGLSRAEVREALWERSHVDRSQVPREWRSRLPDGSRIPVAASPESLILLVAGGFGKHSCWIPTLSSASTVTKPVPSLMGSP